ncbi:MAG: PAS domain-containing protein [Frankiaceae bacterium]|nr:PAS domain-containing protein [Frankiaceae bacterium]MBV9369257.1 PAS domain-containing protein [Frankiales bacterium]
MPDVVDDLSVHIDLETPALPVPVALSSSVLDSAPIAMALTDVHGVVLWSNPAMHQLIDSETVFSAGASLYDVIRTHDVADERRAIEQMLAGETTWYEREQTWIRPDGDRQVRVMATLAVDAAGAVRRVGEPGQPCIIRQVIDVTEARRTKAERKALLAELQARNAELERSNQELEQFASVASHDLSEPLRVIAGHVDLLARRYQGQLDDNADRYIAFAVDGCARMRRLIEDLLRYSRTGRELTWSEVDLGALAAHVVADMAAALEDCGGGVDVGTLPTVAGDATQLGQVLSNLIGNALKFRHPDRPPLVRVSAEERRGVWAVTVADNGVGIPARHRQRVFGLFERLHTQDVPGTGIGLAICRKVVERHGGEITVSDNDAGGSTFTFTLPKIPPTPGES